MEKLKGFKVFWILLIAAFLSTDSAMFKEDHVPYWAYFIRFVVMVLLLVLFQKAVSGDTETVKGRRQTLLLLSAVSAAIISVLVMWFLYT